METNVPTFSRLRIIISNNNFDIMCVKSSEKQRGILQKRKDFLGKGTARMFGMIFGYSH